MGRRRSLPNAFGDTRTPGGDCRRLYSLRSIRRATRRTVSASKSLLLELGDRQVALHVALDDRIEHGVVGQRVGVLLVGTKLGARRLLEHDLGDERAAGALVAIARERVDEHLRHVLDHREGAGHVGAVQRRVAGCHLALVSGGEHETTELVAQRHEHGATDPRLEVLPRQARDRPRTARRACRGTRCAPARSGIVIVRIPRFVASASASVTLPSLE